MAKTWNFDSETRLTQHGTLSYELAGKPDGEQARGNEAVAARAGHEPIQFPVDHVAEGILFDAERVARYRGLYC